MSAPTQPTRPPLLLSLVDRSRYETGLDHCLRDRYLTYHAGPHGYGWQRKAQSVPAVTGDLVHRPITEIMAYLRDHDALPSDEQIGQAIQRAIAEYRRQVKVRGLALTIGEDLDRRVNEQITLLDGLVWTFCRVVLPAFHVEHRVVLVEEEFVVVLGCTCGLGDRIGTAWDHDARECRGIGWMSRADWVSQRRNTGTYRYDEVKTTSDAGMNWEAAWPYRIQMVLGILGAEQRLDAKIDEVVIHGLIKGSYRAEWNPEEGKASGPKFQNSALVYGWRRPANPPLTEEQWAVSYNYVDELGKRRRLTKDYQRTGIWELPRIWWDGPAISPGHFWTGWIGDKVSEHYRQVGPIYRKQWQLDQAQTQVVHHEARWQAVLWELYELAASGYDWETAEFQAALDRLVPQTRGSSCHSYFGDTCPHLALCERADGWQRPDLLGYIPRRPHHAPELDQAISRGLIAPEDQGDDRGE